MNLGEKIKELRLKNNMTQDDLASKCYVTRNAVSKWENDKGYPNIESIKLLCKCFNITIDDFLSDEISNEVVKELTVEVIKNDIKLTRHFDIIVGAIVSLFYFIVQIGLRELALSIDPTSGLAWGLVIAPFCSIIIGIVTSLLIRKHYITYLVGFIGLLISEFFDLFIQNPSRESRCADKPQAPLCLMTAERTADQTAWGACRNGCLPKRILYPNGITVRWTA